MHRPSAFSQWLRPRGAVCRRRSGSRCTAWRNDWGNGPRTARRASIHAGLDRVRLRHRVWRVEPEGETSREAPRFSGLREVGSAQRSKFCALSAVNSRDGSTRKSAVRVFLGSEPEPFFENGLRAALRGSKCRASRLQAGGLKQDLLRTSQPHAQSNHVLTAPTLKRHPGRSAFRQANRDFSHALDPNQTKSEGGQISRSRRNAPHLVFSAHALPGN